MKKPLYETPVIQWLDTPFHSCVMRLKIRVGTHMGPLKWNPFQASCSVVVLIMSSGEIIDDTIVTIPPHQHFHVYFTIHNENQENMTENSLNLHHVSYKKIYLLVTWVYHSWNITATDGATLHFITQHTALPFLPQCKISLILKQGGGKGLCYTGPEPCE